MFRWVVALLCGYEVVAIISGKVPTLTELDRKYKHAISPLMLTGMVVHFYREDVSKWQTTRRS